MPLLHPAPACQAPEGSASGWGQRMQFGESAWGDGVALAGTWEQVLSMRCLCYQR